MYLICGFGLNDRKYPAHYKAPMCWRDMVKRCYTPILYNNPRFRNYEGCTVDQQWKVCSNFCDWAFNQKGFYHPDSCLDKDILLKDNRIYSPETCAFVPREINMAFAVRKGDLDDLPVGVTRNISKTTGRISYTGSVKRGELGTHSKTFTTINDAHEFYISEKLKHLSYLADKYSNYLEDNIYSALKNYKGFFISG